MYTVIYMCVYVYIYVCVYVYICINMYVCVYLYVYICMYVCVYIYMYVKSMSVFLRYQQLIRKVCSKDADEATVKATQPNQGNMFFLVMGKWGPYKLRGKRSLGRGEHHQPPSKHAWPRYEETMKKNANRDEWVMQPASSSS